MNSGRAKHCKKGCFITVCHALALGLAWALALSSAAADPALSFPVKSAVVALDPGHGGRDHGASDPTGALEKSACLDLALKVALKLETQFRVSLTRTADYDVALVQRTAIANQAGADVLVSLHAGSGFVHSAEGISIYCHAPQNMQAGETGHPGKTIGAMLWDQTQVRHQQASLALAAGLKQHLAKLPGAPQCAVRQAPLLLLQGADMPAVLIEIDRITLTAGANALPCPACLDRLSDLISQGIEQFLADRPG